jgi:hypothetical protein
MATDRYSDDHKIVVGGGGGTLTVDAVLDITGNLDVTGNLIVSGGPGDILLSSVGDVTLSSGLGDIFLSSAGNIDIISDDINIESTNTIIDSEYIDLKSSVIKANTSVSFQNPIQKLNAVSKSVFIPGETFIPDALAGSNLHFSYGGGYVSAVASGSARFHLPFIIPDGSTIESITMYCKIRDALDTVNLYLYRATLLGIDTPSDQMALLTSDNSEIGNIQSVSESSILNATINYSSASYYMRLNIAIVADYADLYGVQIHYTTNNIAA